MPIYQVAESKPEAPTPEQYNDEDWLNWIRDTDEGKAYAFTNAEDPKVIQAVQSLGKGGSPSRTAPFKGKGNGKGKGKGLDKSPGTKTKNW